MDKITNQKQLASVKHDYIRYANCWEDADVLCQALHIQPTDKVLSIGSAGDNSFSLLSHSPTMVVAVDINPLQLQLIALKKAAFQALDYSEFLAFLGFRPSTERWEVFQKVSQHLTPEQKTFWLAREHEVTQGIIFSGKFEHYFALFRKRIMPFVHFHKNTLALMAPKSAEQQQLFFQTKWNTWRWRGLFKLFFSQFIMGKFGRDPEFFRQVKVPVSTFILNQATKQLSSTDCQKNYFLRFILTGKFDNELPHYARPENFEKIKTNLSRLHLLEGLAEDAFEQYGEFNKFNLSNIFEYMKPHQFQEVTQAMVKNGAKNARYAYWNLMVPRSMSDVSSVLHTDTANERYAQHDYGFFYGNFLTDIKS